MACYHPVPAVRLQNGDVKFISRSLADCKDLLLPCKQCVGCRLEYSRQWAIRCLDEAAMHKENSFLTLTYSPDSVRKYGRSLDVRHFQLFAKRLRKAVEPLRIRFFIVVNTLRSFFLIGTRLFLGTLFRIERCGL